MATKVVIKAGPDSMGEYLRKTWNYRALILSFAKRDLKVKYAQTLLGIGWTIIQPIVALTLFTFFFGYILKWKTGNIPFALYVYSGLVGWNFFSYIVFQGTTSVMDASQVIKKIYFPKLLLPLSKILVALVELSISLVVFILLMAYFGEIPSWRILLLPFVLLFNALVAFCVVVWIGAFSYQKRDLIHIVPFLMYVGIWITPVFFTIDTLPENLQFIWNLNPMTGIVETWRWCLFPGWKLNPDYLISTFSIVPLSMIGLWFYIRNESLFTEYV